MAALVRSVLGGMGSLTCDLMSIVLVNFWVAMSGWAGFTAFMDCLGGSGSGTFTSTAVIFIQVRSSVEVDLFSLWLARKFIQKQNPSKAESMIPRARPIRFE